MSRTFTLVKYSSIMFITLAAQCWASTPMRGKATASIDVLGKICVEWHQVHMEKVEYQGNTDWVSSIGTDTRLPFLGLTKANCFVFKDRIWRIGTTSMRDDCWSTKDGTTWELMSNDVNWGKNGRTCLVHNNMVWSISDYPTAKTVPHKGGDLGFVSNDVMFSLNGIHWQTASDMVDFGRSESHAALSHRGEMWLFNNNEVLSSTELKQKYIRDFRKRDTPGFAIWSSHNGKKWELKTIQPSFGPRNDFAVVSYKGRLWMIGGTRDGKYLGDVWSSVDGIEWREEASEAAFKPRGGQSCAVFKGMIWLVGGNNETSTLNDVWFTTDGKKWQLASQCAPFKGRRNHALLVHNDMIYVLSGQESLKMPNSLDDIWCSKDGMVWKQVGSGRTIDDLDDKQSAVFNGRLWQVGSIYGIGYVFSSEDGSQWGLMTNNCPTAPVAVCNVFDKKLWMFENGGGQRYWNSADGINWTEGVNIEIKREYNPKMVNFKNNIWLFNEYGGGGFIMKSSDSIRWDPVLMDTVLPVNRGYSVVSFNDKMWLIGGYPFDPNAEGDPENFIGGIWSASNGKDWVLEKQNPEFGSVYYPKCFVIKNTLCVIGNFKRGIKEDAPTNEMWYSRDGVNWHRKRNIKSVFDNEKYTYWVDGERLWLIGTEKGGDVWYTP